MYVRVLAALLVAIAAFALASALDSFAYQTIASEKTNRHDWARMLRVLGYWPTWLVMALAAIMIDRKATSFAWPLTDRWTRAVVLTLSTTFAGLTAELLKLVFRRLRPLVTEGEYVFRAFTDLPLSTKNLGLPSSHVAVAFAGAYILAWLAPSARWVFFGLAFGCALERVLVRAHFVSDAAAGAIIGYGAAAFVRWLHERRWRGRPGGPPE